ncbi:MAG: leucine-rich repeat domain-containing protein [Promethearchaeota archaeon]
MSKYDKKVIKELSKLIGKDFREYDNIKDDDTSYVYTIKEDLVTGLGIDLMKVDLDEDKLKSVDNAIRKLQNLTKLNIKYTRNNELPDCLKELYNLEHLSLRYNNLKLLPKWLKNFKKLKYLDLENNDLTILPEYLMFLNEIQTFKIDNNYNLEWNQKNIDILRALNEKKVKITAPRLFSFQIRHNLSKEKIEIIREIEKDNIEKEKQRQYVNPIKMKIEGGKIVEWRLFEYNFKTLPENFGIFKDLKSLTIIRTPIKVLPNSFGELTNLEFLDLSNNALESLPESFIRLTSIKELNLSNNKFSEVPRELWPLSKITTLDLSGNPFSSEELIISKKIPELILDYLRKEAAIQVFISHAVIDFEPYRIGELVDYLKSQKEISEVFFCEEDLAGNIDEWMLDTVQKCQLLLFIATKKSVFNSADCRNELQLADKFLIPVIPIKGYDVNWPDLAERNLARELGLEFEKDNFDTFCKDLYKYIKNFKREIDLMDKDARQKGIMNIYERFRLILDEKLGEIFKKINGLAENMNSLAERIKSLEKRD